jgi:type I restriction enzyme S subunit
MVESGVAFIRSTNIVNGTLSDKDLVYLTEAKHKELKKGHLKTGDVLITNRGEIGKVAIVDIRFNNSNLNSQIAWLRCNPTLNNQYLLFLLTTYCCYCYGDKITNVSVNQLVDVI